MSHRHNRAIILAALSGFALVFMPGAIRADQAGPVSDGLPGPMIIPGSMPDGEALDGLSSDDPIYVENHLLVGFKPGTTGDEKKALHELLGGQVISEIPHIAVQVLRFRDEDALAMVSAYQAQESVAFAEPDYLVSVFGAPDAVQPTLDGPAARSPGFDDALGLLRTPNDTYYSQQWHHAQIGSATAWDHSLASGVTVAIIDTGVNCNHSDLSGNCVSGYDFVNNDNDPNDDHGHGTHVAGIAAALTDNARGIAATGWAARIMPMKALDRTGNGSHSAIANSIVWATDRGADVINMSLGGPFTSSTLSQATAYAIDRGVTLVAASGNQNSSNPIYPAAYPNVIGVGATTQTDTRASFSNYGTFVDVSAPGVAILSTVRDGGYQAWHGTSMASPIVAGVAALLVGQNPSRSPATIETILEQTAKDLGDPGYDHFYGWGRIDAGRALQHSPGTTTPGPTPTLGPTATPTVPRPSATPSGNFVLQVEELINIERAAVGLSPLHTSLQLRSAADRHSRDMGAFSFCSHDGSDGSTAYERMRDAGYISPYGETIGCGQTSPGMIVETWMNSPPHRAILLCTLCTELGAGYASVSTPIWHYWTVNFGRNAVGGAPTPTIAHGATATPTFTASPTSTPAPPTPTQAAPTGSITIDIPPTNNRIGWVVSSQPTLNHFSNEEDTYTGTWNGRTYHGAMQFDLGAIPLGAQINFARLEMTGRSIEFLGSTGTWSTNILRTDIDPSFEFEGYSGIHNAAIESTLPPLLGVASIGRGVRNTFLFGESHRATLGSRRAGSGVLSLRLDGPTSGSLSNLFTWDTGYGADTLYPGPRLIVNYSTTPTTPEPSATPTDVPPPSATPTDGPMPTPTETGEPPTATFTAPPPPPPTATPTATLPPLPTAAAPGGAVDILPAKEDVGYVRQFESGNHFGESHVYAGYYQGRIYHGGIQFDLSAIPPGAAIRSARLTLSGQSLIYLSSGGNGLWDVSMLGASIDLGWRSSSYTSLRAAPISSKLTPTLRQADLGVGRENVFELADIQLREIEFRAQTTNKVSFRLDGPSGGLRNVMDWDSGFGPDSFGRTPPKLTIVYGPPGSGEPLPTVPPEDEDKIADIIAEINLVRGVYGVPPLVVDGRLEAAAEIHNRDMARNAFFSHIGSDGSTPAERVSRAGYSARVVGQLLAANNGTPVVVVDAWMRQGQRETVIDANYTHAGAHYVFEPGAPYNHYWTIVLTAP